MMFHLRSSLILSVVLILVFALALLPTDSSRAEETEEPESVTLYLAVSSAGEVSLTSGRMDLPIPGSASGPGAFILRVNGTDKVFDLKEHPVGWIKFERSYYQATKLYYQDTTPVLEITTSSNLVDIPNASLINTTKIRTRTGDRSCFDTAFASEVNAVVAYPVRLRLEPYVPLDVNKNWVGSLYHGQKVRVIEKSCNGGPWLRVQLASGGAGWVKEWGFDEHLIQRTFIVTEAQFDSLPTP